MSQSVPKKTQELSSSGLVNKKQPAFILTQLSVELIVQNNYSAEGQMSAGCFCA